MQAGTAYEVERPLVHGDVIDGEDVWMGIVERSKPDRPHRTFIITGERRFTDAEGQPVGKLIMRVFAMAPRDGVAGGETPMGPTSRTRPRYSEEQLRKIRAHYDDEIAGELRRGAEPRFWEDVTEGEALGEVIKGPVDVLDSASFIAMTGGGVGFAEKWMLIKDEIDASPRDPGTGAHLFNMTWHLDDGCARAMGQPYAINFGALVETNFSHAVTNWAGDHALVRLMDNKILAPMYLGETAYISGSVARKFEENGRALVELRLEAKQQDGIPVGSHRATVQLPRRGSPNEVVEAVMSTGRGDFGAEK